MSEPFIYPDWPAPNTVKALSTTRQAGVSLAPYDGFNLASHVGDTANNVQKNRHYLIAAAHLPESPRWLNQVHGIEVTQANKWQQDNETDAIVSENINQVCAIMTADCLPILLCNRQGDKVAAIHGGWRSLATGIIEKTLHRFNSPSQDVLAWLGPAIGPSQFEVAYDVFYAFTQYSIDAQHAFVQTDATHYLADIYLLAKQQLNALGIHAIFGGDFCTVTESARFFSYRRDGITGRMATMIWIDGK